MAGLSFRDRLKAAMATQGLSKAELSRRSGAPYHALDKFLKRENATTSAESARALANAVGIAMDGEAEYEELRHLFFALPEEKQQFVLASIRGLLSETDA